MAAAESEASQTNRRALLGFMTAVVSLGFVLRYALIEGSIVNGDGIFYIWRAKTLMTGDLWNGISAYWSPLYSLLIGLVGYPIQDFESGGRIISLLAGTLLIPATYYLGALLFDKRTGVIAGVLVAANVPLVQASVWVMTESLYGMIFLGIVAVGWLALDRKNISYWIFIGLLTGLAYLTKPEALAFLFLFLPFTLVAAAVDRKSARKLFLGFAIMSCVVAAFVVPYVVFLHAKTGEWTLSKKASTNTFSGVDEDQQLKLINGGRQTVMDELWSDEYLRAPDDNALPGGITSGTPPTLRTKLGWAYQLFRKQVVEYLPALLSIFFLPLIAIGLFSSPWTRSDAARNIYLGAFVVATFLGYSFAVTNIRYLLAIIPLLLILTAYGAVVLARWASESLRKISAGAIQVSPSVFQGLAIVALVVLSAPSIIAKFTEQDRSGMPLEEERAGRWLRSQIGDGSSVMASNATVAYYAGAHHLFLPNEELKTIVEYAKRRDVSFIVFSSRRFTRKHGVFSEIPAELGQDLQLVYSDSSDGDQSTVRIYRVRP